jgi:hypothetical protein
MQNKAIQVKELQKSCRKFHELKDVDFEVGKGSVFTRRWVYCHGLL